MVLRDDLPDLIGLCGAAGSGKSTAAELLARGHYYRRHRFAGPLKAAFRAMLEIAGLRPADIERMIEGDLKERPVDALGGKTPRHAMQTLGTEWGRHCMDERFWIRLALSRAFEEFADGFSRIVFEDVRFPNEAEALRDAGGVLIRLEGRGGITGDHASEGQAFEVDHVVMNEGDLKALEAALLEALLGRWIGRSHGA